MRVVYVLPGREGVNLPVTIPVKGPMDRRGSQEEALDKESWLNRKTQKPSSASLVLSGRRGREPLPLKREKGLRGATCPWPWVIHSPSPT